MKILYSFFYTIAFCLALPYFLLIAALRGKYFKSATQRFGFIGLKSETPCCWIHAVSVGELLAARALIARMIQEFPNTPLFVSTTTLTAQSIAAKLVPGRAFFFPFDWKFAVKRVFQALSPRLVLVVETEIWPNFLWEAEKGNISVLLINGRISDRSYPWYRLIRLALPQFSGYLMQTAEDAARIAALGVSKKKVHIIGNVKFDIIPPSLPFDLRQLLSEWKGDHLLWIAGSTMRGEEENLAAIFQQLVSQRPLKLLVAPRHPERFDEVEAIFHAKSIPCTRRSGPMNREAPVLILDSIGELAALYQLADFVFVGGTTGDHGGHNPIEPAVFGKAIMTGSSYRNFRAIFEEMKKENAILISDNLLQSAAALLNDEDMRFQMGVAAQKLVERNRGATERILAMAGEYLQDEIHVESNQELSVR